MPIITSLLWVLAMTLTTVAGTFTVFVKGPQQARSMMMMISTAYIVPYLCVIQCVFPALMEVQSALSSGNYAANHPIAVSPPWPSVSPPPMVVAVA